MKLGLGLYRHLLNRDHYQFAAQAGATHIVAHLCDYFARKGKDGQPTDDSNGWGKAGSPLWSLGDLQALKKEINDAGLELEAIENFDPGHWYDVLLDGPEKARQLEDIKTMIRNVGRAGIPIIGYNFSLAGVCSRVTQPAARGQAPSACMERVDETPVPNGMVWNMVYDEKAPAGTLRAISHDELWQRLEAFLEAVLPVAEEEGVKLAAHPDDPPVPVLRQTPRLVYQPDMYQRLIDLYPSPASGLEFCLGSIAEMTEGDVYEATEQYGEQGKIFYVHFRNVQGKVPTYREVFVDEGDIDMVRVLRILRDKNFTGVLIPDHTPQMHCDAPWHAGMAFAMGYMKAAMRLVMEE
jgi:mannonate dehydratase